MHAMSTSSEFNATGCLTDYKQFIYSSDICVAVSMKIRSLSLNAKTNARRTSALDHVDRKPAARSLLVFDFHVSAGFAHGLDHLVERDEVVSIAAPP